MSQDVFQQKKDQVLENRTIGITDNVIMSRKNWIKHNRDLHKLMKVAKEKGLIFNSSKCNVKTKLIKFFGAVYDEKGI